MKKISLKNWFVTPTLYSSCAMVPNRKTVGSPDSLILAGTRDYWNRGFDSFRPSRLLARPLTVLYTDELGVLKTSCSTSSEPRCTVVCQGFVLPTPLPPPLANTSPSISSYSVYPLESVANSKIYLGHVCLAGTVVVEWSIGIPVRDAPRHRSLITHDLSIGEDYLSQYPHSVLLRTLDTQPG
jgi:hypothetical protein